MSPSATATGKSWTCADCGVVASYDPPRSRPAPEGWAKRGSDWVCLHCRREEVRARATGESKADLNSSRRRALTEFELLRDPEAADIVIARRVRCAAAVVRPIRASLRKAGKLPRANGPSG
jgi:hypothetical protein